MLGRFRKLFCYTGFYCNDTNFTLSATEIWCNTEIIGKITLLEANKTYDNIDTEDPMWWIL